MKLTLILLLLPIFCWAGIVDLTDKQGREIQAELVKIDMGYLTLKKGGGSRFTIPMATLSQESQELVQRFFAEEKHSTQKVIKSNRSTNSTPLKLELTFNSDVPEEVVVDISNSDTRKKKTQSVSPTDKEIDISGLDDGDYTIAFKATGYANQWYRGNIRKGKFSPRSLDIDLRKKRYVVIRYSINLDASPSLDGEDLYSGVAAFSDRKYGNPQHFLGWYTRQADLGEKRFGDDFILQWGWMVPNAGICVREEDFEDIISASEDKFSLRQIKLEKGVVFTCKSSYSRNPDLYGKFEVVDIVDEPSEDMEVY